MNQTSKIITQAASAILPVGLTEFTVRTDLDSAHGVLLSAVVVYYGYIIVTNVPLLVVTLLVVLPSWHHRGHVKHHCNSNSKYNNSSLHKSCHSVIL